MSEKATPTALESSAILTWAIILGCAILMLNVALKVPVLGAGGVVVDFDAFYIVGQMAWAGKLLEAYDQQVMFDAQSALAGERIFMPWTYPPQFDFVAMLFPLATRGISYGIFMACTFAAYVFVLKRLAGPYLTGVLVAIFPALIITIWIGQNGFMTGALVGLFCLAWLQGRSIAGIPLGLMIIKPHLGIGLGLLAVISGRWKVLAIGLAVVGLSSALATAVFGTGVWTAFVASTGEAAESLEEGLYPLFRMTSIYACLLTFDFSPAVAFAAQACLAALASFSIIFACLKAWTPQRTLGLTVLATLAFSPYGYDYDMPILGIGLALLAPDILARANSIEKLGLLGLAWLCCGWGLFSMRLGHVEKIVGIPHSLGAIGHIALWGSVWFILLRNPNKAAQPVLQN